MARRELIKKVTTAARKQGAEWILDREGANHTVYTLNGLVVPVPRHREISHYTAEGIYRECEPELGKDWRR